MLIPEEKAEELLNSENNLVNILNRQQGNRQPDAKKIGEVEIRPANNGGRRPGDSNLTPAEREAVGILSQFVPAKELNQLSGVSPSQISALKKGAHSTASYDKTNTATRDAIDAQLLKIKDKALFKVMQSLDLLTEEKMEKVSAVQISTIAANLARVASTNKTSDEEGIVKSAKIIIYSPKLNILHSYGTPLEVESNNQ